MGDMFYAIRINASLSASLALEVHVSSLHGRSREFKYMVIQLHV